MNLIADWLLIILTSWMALNSYKKIIRERTSSVAHFIILIEYLFLSTPILLNYCMGVPKYTSISWYKTFLSSMTDARIAVIYDLYILISMAVLYWYAIKHDRGWGKYVTLDEVKYEGFFANHIVLTLIILSPLIQILLTGQGLLYLIYSTSSVRGIESSDFLVYQFMLLQCSIIAFCYRIFSTPITKWKVVIILLYSFMIAWISGKRFMIALLLLIYIFCLTRSGLHRKNRRNLERFVPLLFVALVVFSYFYLVIVKPLSDTSFASIYDMLRVDFGRDDVIKFVIEQELFRKEPILDYRGQTFLSEFLTFVPRSLWPNKPYPHYVYLTSEILGVARNNLPAGTTPSWFEMCIANFSWFGFVVGIAGIPLLCRWCDKKNTMIHQLLILIFIMALITQSMSAYTVILMLLVAKGAIKLLLNKRKIVFVFNTRR